MMRKRILKCTLLSVSSLLLCLPLSAQTDSIPAKEKSLHGLSLSADVFGLVGGLFGNDFQSMEVAAELHLHPRFYPIVEVGYGTTDTTDDDKDIHYKVSAPYCRVGFNYNFFHKKETQSIVFGGLRVGYTTFSFDVDAPALTDPVWGGSVPFEYKGVKSNATWAELVVGLRTPIARNFHMGWSVRYKRRLSVKEDAHADAWYVPGYGENRSILFGATYNLIYYLPW